MDIPAYVKNVMDTITRSGHQCFLAGGCVRDHLLGQTPKDYDLTTDAHPEEVLALFGDRARPTGLQHGTVTVMTEAESVEITTFRTEGAYSDNRHPDSVTFVSDIHQDLARRDFTINAMAYSPETGLVDPFGGQADLKAGLIRAVGDPDRRFEEDALRMVRAHRFAARCGFEIETQTLAAIDRNEALIANVAVERLYKEWMEILKTRPAQIAEMTGLFRPWIPELEESLQTPQNSPYHYTDVLHHILDSISYLEPFDETLALTLLLHDLGKPECRTTSPSGRDHFSRHPLAGEKIARRVTEELKLSNRQKQLIPLLVRHHDDVLGLHPGAVYDFRIRKGWSDEMMQDLFKVQYCDIMAHSPTGRKRLQRWSAATEYYAKTVKGRPLSYADLDITGHDIVAFTGLRNRQIHVALDRILEYCFYEPQKNNRLDILTFLLKNQKRIAQEAS